MVTKGTLQTLQFEYVPKNKQNKIRQTKNNELKEKSYLNYTAIIKYAFCFLILLYFIR